jgi:hypothetical protein
VRFLSLLMGPLDYSVGVVREYRLVDNGSTVTSLLVTILVETLRFGDWWKNKT